MNLSFQQCKLLFVCHIRLRIHYIPSILISGSLTHIRCMTVHTYKPVYLNVNTIVLCALVSWIITENLYKDAISVLKLLKAYT